MRALPRICSLATHALSSALILLHLVCTLSSLGRHLHVPGIRVCGDHRQVVLVCYCDVPPGVRHRLLCPRLQGERQPPGPGRVFPLRPARCPHNDLLHRIPGTGGGRRLFIIVAHTAGFIL